jgi:opacity protein-like surface antigen
MTFSAFHCALLACFLQAGSAFFCLSATAQNTSEVGLGVGALNYKGEVSPQFQWQNSRPALTVFYRKDVSAPVTLRGGFTAGFLRADDGNVKGVNGGVPPLQATRQTNMKGSLLEASAVLEYNFLDYHNRGDHVHFTPYGFIGLAGYYASTSSQTLNPDLRADFNRSGNMLGLAVPVGVGFKYALSQFINLGLEIGARKTFTDRLDHLYDQTPLLVNPHDQDWYYYTGLSISYTFYKIPCPDQYKDNPKLLR